ncbi:hypothetical protein CHS0354_029489 [Potamilus streckersoni]|uniref:Uncharacterized protein n=1 Tax=Potamilus streckersoni TaxID=2493646 RepID=A0AAE0S7C1_9BIVA|nr:hypothetical protein CHS0354_029489 [Potamilus streckersoni]
MKELNPGWMTHREEDFKKLLDSFVDQGDYLSYKHSLRDRLQQPILTGMGGIEDPQHSDLYSVTLAPIPMWLFHANVTSFTILQQGRYYTVVK